MTALRVVDGFGVLLVIVLAHVLLASSLSATTLFGSTKHFPAARGFTKVPATLGVAVNETSNDPPAPIVTLSVAKQVRSLPEIPQFILVVSVLFAFVTDTEP